MTHEDAQTRLDRITDLLVDDILQTSDKEIMKEAEEDGYDAKNEAKKVYNLIQKTMFEHGKAKIEEAQKRSSAYQGNAKPALKIPGAQKRELFKTLSSKGEAAGFTLAARKEEDLSDRDIESVLEDMLELGLIDEDGNEV